LILLIKLPIDFLKEKCYNFLKNNETSQASKITSIVRLADILRENGFKKNQRVLLHIDPNKPSIQLEP